MRLNELFESVEPEYYASEEAISNSDLRIIFDGVISIASKLRSTSIGGALFYGLSYEDKVRYFNEIVLPIYVKHKYPIPGKTPYGPFQEEIRDLLRSVKQETGVDYYDQEVAKKALGLS